METPHGEPGALKDKTIAKLANYHQTVLLIDDKELHVGYGFDPTKPDQSQDGLTYVIEPDQKIDGVIFVDKQGQEVEVGGQSSCDFADIAVVRTGGGEKVLGRDVWLNPTLGPKLEQADTDPRYKDALEANIAIWEAATKGREEVDRALDQKLDRQTVKEIREVIAYLKQHPELQNLSVALHDIDPWELASLSAADLESKINNLPRAIRSTQMETDIRTIVGKIANQAPLSDEDIIFLNALALKDIAIQQSTHTAGMVQITDNTEQYALANLAENYLFRQFIPPEVFAEHQRHYSLFATQVQAHGLDVPDWFAGYRGDQFTYGPAVNGVIANAGGKYFFGPQAVETSSVSGILDHERIHVLETLSRSENRDYIMPVGVSCSESYTETMALLIKHEGDQTKAIADLAIYRTGYRTGVVELLTIIGEINAKSGDPFLGAKLMFAGLIRLREGTDKNLREIESWYDANIAPETSVSFATKMLPYEDRRMARFAPVRNIPTVEHSYLSQEIARIAIHLGVDQRSAEQMATNPTWLVSNMASDKSREVYRAIALDPQAKAELQHCVDAYYLAYIDRLKMKLAEVV